MRLYVRRLSCLILLLIFSHTGLIQADIRYQRGPFSASEAKPAPQWIISEWLHGTGTNLKDLQGQVVVIDFFQLWCPGCNSFSIPLMVHWEEVFADEIAAQKIKLVSIHTVFEGHQYQNNERLSDFIREKEMSHAVGVDKQVKGKRLPETMIRYDTRGTPEMAIIDKRGRIRFQKFGGFDPDWATDYIRDLLNEADT